ncbi:hypothetical protein M569_04013, partial [Genlisea aurea]
VIVAAPDGTVHLVEIESGKILWSFSSGSSIYSSYQLIPNHEGEKLNSSSVDEDNFYIDCGDDWELYLHGKGLRKVVPVIDYRRAEEFVKRTPFVSAGGGVMLGSKKTSAFLLNAETGKVVRSFKTDNSPSFEFNADAASSFTTTEIEEWLPSTSDSTEKPLYVTRTDYALSYTSVKTGKVLWYLMFADIEASFVCDGIENFFGSFPDDTKFRSKQGLDGKFAVNCHTRPVVYRIRDRSSLENLFIGNGLQDAALPGEVHLSLPMSEDQDKEADENSLALRNNEESGIILALPSSDHKELTTRSPDDDGTPQVDSLTLAQLYHWPFVICSALVTLASTFLFFFRGSFIRGSGKQLHTQSKDLKLQSVAPRKKKPRKSVMNKQRVISERHLLQERSDDNGNPFEERRLGKLVVTNKEIAKGSNGTIVLEGNYNGRSVAVKRLVRTHHGVAEKEIQNLIVSDQHPNIVRWYGVEYDQDFVYLCLERCACNLQDLISFSASPYRIPDDHQSIDYDLQSMRKLGTEKELEFWKPNGHPSSVLLKLLRDIACGLAHMHELGIVHRDLKPQNVLIIKDRSVVSAKISDMGISKHLDREMSSLSKHITADLTAGHGSSGWQAPEQLRGLRQTRAVDLFSLGCIFFFCITGGKHPFGETLERDVNIVNNQRDLFLVDHMPEAADIISRLLDPSPELRPKAAETLRHPVFWSSEMRLSFLRDASDRVELEDGSELLQELENMATGVGRWDEKMDTVFIQDLGRYRRYKYDSVRDLLRVIRNKLNHYRELSKEVQLVLGSVPDGFDSYFSTRFPRLLMEVYRVIIKYCADEEIFHKY